MLTAQITCVLPVAIKTEPSACGAISGVTRHSRSPSPVRFELRRRVSGCGLFSMFSVSGKRDNNAGRAKSQGKDEIERSASRQRSPAPSAAVFDDRTGRACLSPRPQGRRHSCTRLGQELLREAKAFGLTGRWLPMLLRSRRDAPYLARVAKPLICVNIKPNCVQS